ncbi:MAG TPA: glycosyltransferase family 39 protein [Dissulfurispiraceae bacterium]
MKRPGSDTAFYLVFFGALLISTALKLAFIDSRELWLDETYSSFLVGKGFSQMMDHIRGDVHPPLYYLCLKLWALLFGASPHSLRACSVFINVLASLVFFALAKKVLKGRWIALLCFLLFQFSPVLFWYSVEVRMYMLATLLVVVSAFYFIRLTETSRPAPRDMLLFSLLSACAFYTHYLTVLVLAGYFVFYLAKAATGRLPFKPLIASAAVILLITSPWYPTVFQQRTNRARIGNELQAARQDPNTLSYLRSAPAAKSTAPGIVETAENLSSILGMYPLRSRPLAAALGIPFAVVLAHFAAASFRGGSQGRFIITVACAFVTGAVALGAHERRYLIFLTPFLILMTGIAARDMLRADRPKAYRRMSLLIIFALLAFHVAGTVRVYAKDYCKPTTGVVRFIKDNSAPGDLVVFNSLYYQIPFDYYAPGYRHSLQERGFPVGIHDWWDRQPFKGWGGPVITRSDLSNFLGELKAGGATRSIWVVLFETNYYDPRNQLLSSLKARYPLTECRVDFGNCEEKKGCEEAYRVFRAEVHNPSLPPLN